MKISIQLTIIFYTAFLSINACGQTASEFNDFGISKFNLGDYKGAMEDFNKAIEYDSTHWHVYISRGDLKLELGDYRGALNDYNTAVRISGIVDGDNEPFIYSIFPFLLNRAFAKLKLGDFKGVIEDCNKSIENYPRNNKNLLSNWEALSYYYRGFAKYNLGNSNSACIDWSKAGELGYMEAYEAIKEYCNK